MLRPDVPKDYFKNGRDLLFQIIDWCEFDINVEVKNEDDEDEGDQDVEYSFASYDNNKKKSSGKPYKKKEFMKKQMIRGYGVTEEGHSICINVLDFQPYFYLSLPHELTDAKSFETFVNLLKSKVGDYHSKGLVCAEIVERKQFYGFTNNELFKYAKLTFHSTSAYNAFKNKLQSEDEIFNFIRMKKEFNFSKNLCETKVKPMLRFFHTQNLDPAGWMTIKHGHYSRNVSIGEDKFDINSKHSRCQIEVNCVYDKIHKVDKSVIGKILIASFDIECVSNDGSFPKPTNALDPVIQIGTTVYIFGEKECKLSYIATLGACDPIENAIVESFKSEKEVILGWAKFMAKLDPDIVTGYNIWGFDWTYLYKRAETGNGGLILPYHEQLFNTLQRTNREKKAMLTDQKLSSAALGDNFLYFIDIEGVLQIDLLKVMMRDYKLDSYKLDNVAKHFMKQQKVDLSPKELFANYRRGTPKDIQEIAIYCIKDCDLVNRLMDNRQVIVSNIGMANVCVVPFSYLFLKGQGIKIFSLVAKITREEGFVVKDLNSDDIDDASYEGAIVFVPTPGVYFEPVVVMDYNSLYPSSMIAENISHDSIVGYKEYRIKPQTNGGVGVEGGDLKSILMASAKNKPVKIVGKKKKKGNLQDENDLVCNESNCELIEDTIVKKYDNLPEYNYNNISYDVFEGVGDDKKKVGFKVCRFAELKSGEKALLPRILRVLLKARKDTRKKMEYQNMYMRDGTVKVGIVTTSDKRAVVSEIDPKEDPNDFCIFEALSKDNGEEYSVFNVLDGTYKVKRADILRVQDTYTQGEIDVLEGLQLAYKVVCNSLYGQVGASTSPICYKELAASTTATGRNMVIHARDTTLKHFVGAKLTYGDSVTGDTPVLLRNPETHQVYVKSIADLTTSKGAATFDSSPGDEPRKLNDQWESYEAFKPWDATLREKEQTTYDAEIWTAHGWAKIHRVIRHKTVKKIYRVMTQTGFVDVTEDHSLLSPTLQQVKPKDVAVGTKLRHGTPFDYHSKYYGPSDRNDEIYVKTFDLNVTSMVEIQREFIQLRKEKMYVLLKRSSSNDISKLDMVYSGYCLYKDGHEDEITHIDLLRDSGIDEYVYDIETSDGTFQAGIGQMIVKNTDSIFVNFTDHIKQKYPGREFTEQELLEESIKIGQEAAKNVNKDVKAPQNIEYEKTFWPFVIFSKKRYFGNKYEKSIEKYKETSMGIVLKRRDNAPILKTIYKGIIDIILNKRNMEAAKLFFRESVKNLLEGKADISQLVISKTLKADYANPTQIAHKVLADRMGERDEGNKPQSNDRIPYCYIDASNWKCILCKTKVNEKNCKCNTCMGMFCFQHMGNHKSRCTPVCRFCKKTDKILGREFKDEIDSSMKNFIENNVISSVNYDKLENCYFLTKEYDNLLEKMKEDGIIHKSEFDRLKEWKKLEKCNTCTAYYCPGCFVKHKKRKDKYGVEHTDKCKKGIVPKLLQGDLIEHPQYIEEAKLKIDFMYYYEHQIMKPVFQIFELNMPNPESIVADLITKYHNQKSGAQPISNFFIKKPKVEVEAKVEKKRSVNDDSDSGCVIEKLKPKAKKKVSDTSSDLDSSPKSPSFDINELKVDEKVKEEILKSIEDTMKKKEVMTIADGAPDGDDGSDGEGEGGEKEDINLALEIFEEVEDIYRDINEID